MEITSIGNENFEYFEPYTFGPLSPEQSALGLIEEEEAVGAVVVSENEGVCTIDSLFVDPEHQRKGGGRESGNLKETPFRVCKFLEPSGKKGFESSFREPEREAEGRTAECFLRGRQGRTDRCSPGAGCRRERFAYPPCCRDHESAGSEGSLF